MAGITPEKSFIKLIPVTSFTKTFFAVINIVIFLLPKALTQATRENDL
jgi:hypothetical protein